MTEDWADLGAELERFFSRRARHPADSEDLAQETLIRVLARWDQLRDHEARRAWTFTIAYNLLRDHYRRSTRETLPLSDADMPTAVAAPLAEQRVAIREAVSAAMSSLPLMQRHVLVLRLLEDLSFGQIARRLGIPEATARTRAFHGIRCLRAAVATRLRKEGLVVECDAVRERLLQMAFGLSEERSEEEVRRHLAACVACRREVDVVNAMWRDTVARVQLPVLVGGWSLHDAEGNATSYWLNEQVNRFAHPTTKWTVSSSWAPDLWTWFDVNGQRLEDIGHEWDEDHWRMHIRLRSAWEPGAVLRVVGAVPMHLETRTTDSGWSVTWSELPLPDSEGLVKEILCRRALQLPPGFRATTCDPEPDRRGDEGGLLTWSMILGAGERLRLQVGFAAQ